MNLTGSTTACMIQDVGNNQVLNFLQMPIKNLRAMKLYGVVVQIP